jgi:hypothetical protein
MAQTKLIAPTGVAEIVMEVELSAGGGRPSLRQITHKHTFVLWDTGIDTGNKVSSFIGDMALPMTWQCHSAQ